MIKRDTFVQIMAEMLVIENLNVPQNEKALLIQQVFKKHNIDRELFEKTRENHKQNPQYWIKVYTSAKELISTQADSLVKQSEQKPDNLQLNK